MERTEEKTVVGTGPKSAGEQAKTPFVIVIAGHSAGKMVAIPASGQLIIGREAAADLSVNDGECSRRHAKIYKSSSGLIYAEDLGSTNGTFVNGQKINAPQLLNDGDHIAMGTSTVLKFSLQDAVEEEFQTYLYQSATRDSLTGAYNKRFFLETLEREIKHHLRHKRPLCLAMIDLDHFKKINDTYGHLAGDEVLKHVSGIISGAIRTDNIFCRYGGEEFSLILPSTLLQNATGLAERLRELVAASPTKSEQHSIPVTISVGIAILDEGTKTRDHLIAAADKQLYNAKNSGRNRVCA